MTINELEQGIRNLIASQPMIMSGPSGEVLNGILSMIDAFRNLSFKTQTYPCNDMLKFSMTNEVQTIENNFSNMVCSTLQERGINLFLYVPKQVSTFAQGYGQFGMVDPNMVMGQMMYGYPASSMGTGQYMQSASMQPQMAHAKAFGTRTSSGFGNQTSSGMQIAGNSNEPRKPQPQMQEPRQNTTQKATKRQSNSGVQNAANSESSSKNETNAERKIPQSAVKTIQKTTPKTQEASNLDNHEPDKKVDSSPAEMMMGGSSKNSGGAGRDYLMELLKK